MMNKLILTLLILISSLHAEEIFSELPYGMVLGKALPVKVETRLTKTKFQNQVTGKFAVKIDEDSRILHSVLFSFADYDMPTILPKIWRRAGLKLCYDNRDGTSYEKVKEIIHANGAYEIDESDDQYRIMIDFRIDSDKQYELVLYKKSVPNDHGKGLAYITITQQSGSDGYIDDDY